MGGDWGLGFLSKNDDITSFQGSLKVLMEISVILKGYFHYRKIAVEQETELLKFSTYFFILI
jgi:hypothetical protein